MSSKTDSAAKNDQKRTVEFRDSIPTPSQSTGMKMGMKKVRSCDVLKSDELGMDPCIVQTVDLIFIEKLNVKLAKNRESARNSRIRKKLYIDLLEKTVDQLQTELVNTRKQLETSTNSVSKASIEAKPVRFCRYFLSKTEIDFEPLFW